MSQSAEQQHDHDLRYDPIPHIPHSPTAPARYRLVCVARGKCDESDMDDNYVVSSAVDGIFPEGFDPVDARTWPKYRPSLYDDRNPAVRNVMRWLEPNQALPDAQFAVANEVWQFADNLIKQLPDGPELTVGLRKLLEAKDCFVRASLSSQLVSA